MHASIFFFSGERDPERAALDATFQDGVGLPLVLSSTEPEQFCFNHQVADLVMITQFRGYIGTSPFEYTNGRCLAMPVLRHGHTPLVKCIVKG